MPHFSKKVGIDWDEIDACLAGAEESIGGGDYTSTPEKASSSDKSRGPHRARYKRRRSVGSGNHTSSQIPEGNSFDGNSFDGNSQASSGGSEKLIGRKYSPRCRATTDPSSSSQKSQRFHFLYPRARKRNSNCVNEKKAKEFTRIFMPMGMCLICSYGVYRICRLLLYFLVGVVWSQQGDSNVYLSNEWQAIKRLHNAKSEFYAHQSWPVSVREEEMDFELIQHPVLQNITLRVPRFYLGEQSPVLVQGKLLTPKVAKDVGIRLTHGTGLRSEQSYLHSRTIFVNVVSYRDWRCRYTIESIFAKAQHPERIRIGVVDQIDNEDPSCDAPIEPCGTNPNQALCKYRDQIDVYQMESNLSVGPTLARHIAQRMYRGEYYTLQTGAHVTFVKNWDADVIDQHVATKNEMAVLSTYLVRNEVGATEETGVRRSWIVVCHAEYQGYGRTRRLRQLMEQQPHILATMSSPELQPYWSSDLSFARGHFLLNVPYDPYLPMVRKEDEQISIGIRGFTHGYDFYTPQRNIGYDSSDEKTQKSFLEHAQSFKGREELSLVRLDNVISLKLNNDDIRSWNKKMSVCYGVGHVRTASRFYTIHGVHVSERITERKLCNFVTSGRMHEKFTAHLRSDGMGIDYNQIHFRFHELQSNHADRRF